jgi:sugar lactone lactonase YvrE
MRWTPGVKRKSAAPTVYPYFRDFIPSFGDIEHPATIQTMWTPLANSLCDLGESPFWHPREGALYWIDIAGRAVLRTRGRIGTEVAVERWPLPQEPGCIAPARSGGLVLALRDGVYRAREWGGALQRITGVPFDTARMRFNDGKCDPQGRFWAGSINEAKDARSAALYCLMPPAPGAPAQLQAMLGDAITANGLAFGPDQLYWADTPSHAVRVWDWVPEANRIGAGRIWRQFGTRDACAAAGQPYGGRPDGATRDAQGGYWVAMYEGAQVLQLDAQGHTQRALPVPAQCPTMPCFGGDDLRTLFVTSARKGRPADECARLPDSGRVFFTRGEGAGVPVDFFAD